MTTLTLSASGLAPLTIGPAPIECVELDLGEPIDREVAEAAPDADGEIDSTHLSGARIITFGVLMQPWTRANERRLRAFRNPRLRPLLTVSEDDVDDVQATVRVTSVDGPFGADEFHSGQRLFAVTCRAPSGIFESAELHQTEVAASGESEAGRTYDLEFDRVYPESAPVGEVVVVNAGDRHAYPLIQLYGPWSGETSVVNVEAGAELVFDGEIVADGDYLEIDTRRKTITLNGDPANSRYNRLQFPGSSWWALAPGTNTLRFLPETFDAPARMLVAWRDAYS